MTRRADRISAGGGIGSLPPLRALKAWRQRRRASPLWTAGVAVILAVTLLPVASILWLAVSGKGGGWIHLAANVLPAAIGTTLLLLAGVGMVTAVIGTATAWLVTQYRFPGRDTASWLLLLPLAVPTYIVAYSYGALLDYAGPMQTGLRALFGFVDRRGYWFPEVRSLPGAALVLASVLYPYVYLSMRASFLQQSVGTLEVARTLGQSMTGAFFRVALPLARPALAGGLALVLMEALNDLGATEYLGVRTLTVSAYQTWLQRSSLAGAAEIAAITLFFVAAAFALERASRGGGSYHDPVARWRPVPEIEVNGAAGWGMLTIVLVPVLLGFVLPMLMLTGSAWRYLGEVLEPDFWRAAFNSLVLAALAAGLATALALFLAYARRVAPNGFTKPAVRLTGFGYALPGTILALGLLVPLAALDNGFDGLMRSWLGVSTGLILSGTIFAVLLAYLVRFMAVALSATAKLALQPVADQRSGKAAAMHRMDRLSLHDPPRCALKSPLGKRRAKRLGAIAIGRAGPPHPSGIKQRLVVRNQRILPRLFGAEHMDCVPLSRQPQHIGRDLRLADMVADPVLGDVEHAHAVTSAITACHRVAAVLDEKFSARLSAA